MVQNQVGIRALHVAAQKRARSGARAAFRGGLDDAPSYRSLRLRSHQACGLVGSSLLLQGRSVRIRCS